MGKGVLADLRFGEGGILAKGPCVPKTRPARGGSGGMLPLEIFEI